MFRHFFFGFRSNFAKSWKFNRIFGRSFRKSQTSRNLATEGSSVKRMSTSRWIISGRLLVVGVVGAGALYFTVTFLKKNLLMEEKQLPPSSTLKSTITSRPNNAISTGETKNEIEKTKQEHVVVKTEPSHSKFVLHSALVMNFIERFLIYFMSAFTLGLLYPYFKFQYLQDAINNRINLDGRKLKFTGDLTEFYYVWLKNCLLTAITFGIYGALGYTEINEARYIDEHIEWA